MNQLKEESLQVSGERFIPGKSGKRIEADHLERYRFACQYARNKKILDIACGSGYGAPLLVEAGATQYVGVDIDEKSVRYAEGHYGSERCSFIVASICDFRAAESYDLVTCFETIEHVECYRSALRNLYSVLKPGGLMLISSPNRPITSPRALRLSDKPKNKFHSQEFTLGELLEELLMDGFIVSEKNIYGQRQRWVCKNKYIELFIRFFYIPDIFAFITSPKVTPMINQVPRYFVIVAKKKET